MTEIGFLSIASAAADKAEVGPSDGIVFWTVANPHRVLGRRSREGRPRDPSPGPILKEQACTN